MWSRRRARTTRSSGSRTSGCSRPTARSPRRACTSRAAPGRRCSRRRSRRACTRASKTSRPCWSRRCSSSRTASCSTRPRRAATRRWNGTASRARCGPRPDRAGPGGSTLATQIEKFRHSPEGITSSPREKLRQMLSASLRAYHGGERHDGGAAPDRGRLPEWRPALGGARRRRGDRARRRTRGVVRRELRRREPAARGLRSRSTAPTAT